MFLVSLGEKHQETSALGNGNVERVNVGMCVRVVVIYLRGDRGGRPSSRSCGC